MCARSHTSGLINAEWAVSTSASERAPTSASVRSRASARSAAAAFAAWRGCVAAIPGNATGWARRPAIQARGRPARRQTSTTSRTDAVRHEMRESRGRTTSSKRPDSSCSSSVTSAWKRRPFLSTRTMSPAPMPFEVVRFGRAAVSGSGSTSIRVACGSGIEPARLRAAPDGGGDRLPHLPVQRDVLVAVRAHRDDRGPLGGHGAAERGAEALEVLRALVAATVELRDPRGVEPVRGGDVLDVVGALSADGEEREDAAAVVVDQDDRQLQAEPGGGEQPADVVGERDVAGQQHGGAVRRGGRGAEGGRD